MTRLEIFQELTQHPNISVLIIGGGINGAGLLRELAMQGIDTLLIDKSDFCAGASAASTRVIHGGLRYLENGEFRLVRESTEERNRLLQNASHYVKPLPTTIPITSWTAGIFYAFRNFFRMDSKPGERGAIVIKAGLALYDYYSKNSSFLPPHFFSSRSESFTLRPILNPEVVCTATFYDARITHPERLCLELVLDAEQHSQSALALNYVSVQRAKGPSVELKDEITGKVFLVYPRIVINATGAWIDLTNRSLNRETQYIGGTKGSHLVIENQELRKATGGEMLYHANKDGRICVFLPLFDKVLAGTTDIPVNDPENASCERDEVNYILDSVRQVFPSINISRSDVVFQFCGVRPLPRSAARIPGQISRDHHCQVIHPSAGIDFPIFSLIGGKWTIFRAFAEQVSALVMPLLGRQRLAWSENEPIGGGRNYPRTNEARHNWFKAMQNQSGLSVSRLDQLLDRYGTECEPMLPHMLAGSDRALDSHSAYTRAEILYLACNEKVEHLDDIVLRRTLIGLLGQTSYRLLEELNDILSNALSWSEARKLEEITRTVDILQTKHGVTLKSHD